MSKRAGAHPVVSNPDGAWNFKAVGATRSSGHFDKKQESVDAGRKISRKQETEFSIQGKDGKSQNKESRGDCSQPPKGWSE